MEITWLGRTCFRLKGRDGVVITDPCPPESGYKLGKQQASIVTLSRRDDPGYSWTEGVEGGPVVLDAPGEYEIAGILVTGVATKAVDGGRNIIFVCEIDGLRICHLGLLGEIPPTAMLEDVNDVDILLLPVGGGNALTAARAQDVMTTFDPRVAIPMNYKTDLETAELGGLEGFLRETGSKAEPQQRITITRSQVPSELTIMLLEPKQ